MSRKRIKTAYWEKHFMWDNIEILLNTKNAKIMIGKDCLLSKNITFFTFEGMHFKDGARILNQEKTFILAIKYG